MRSAVKLTGVTIIDEISHQFESEGMTAVLLLSESHASIHTYPRYLAALIDIFTCGHYNPNGAISEIKKALNPTKTKSIILAREQP